MVRPLSIAASVTVVFAFVNFNREKTFFFKGVEVALVIALSSSPHGARASCWYSPIYSCSRCAKKLGLIVKLLGKSYIFSAYVKHLSYFRSALLPHPKGHAF